MRSEAVADRFYRTAEDARRVESCLAACEGIETETVEKFGVDGRLRIQEDEK